MTHINLLVLYLPPPALFQKIWLRLTAEKNLPITVCLAKKAHCAATAWRCFAFFEANSAYPTGSLKEMPE